MSNHPRPVPRARTQSMPASNTPTPAPRSPRIPPRSLRKHSERESPASTFDVAGWNNTSKHSSLTLTGKKKLRPPPLAELGLPHESALDDWLGMPTSAGSGPQTDTVLYVNQSQNLRDIPKTNFFLFSCPETDGAGPADDPARGKLTRGRTNSGSVISMNSNSTGSFCSSRGSFNSVHETTEQEQEEGDRKVVPPPPFGFGDDDAHYDLVDQPSSDVYADVDQVRPHRSASAPPRSISRTYHNSRSASETPPPLPPPNRNRRPQHHQQQPVYDEWTDPAGSAVPQYANQQICVTEPTSSAPLPNSPGKVDQEIEDCMAEIFRLQSLQVTTVRRASAISADDDEPFYDQLQTP